MIAGQGTVILKDKSSTAALELTEQAGQPLDPDHEYVINVTGGTTAVQAWDGAGWVAATAVKAGYVFIPPSSGRMRVNVTVGTATINVFRRAWRS